MDFSKLAILLIIGHILATYQFPLENQLYQDDILFYNVRQLNYSLNETSLEPCVVEYYSYDENLAESKWITSNKTQIASISNKVCKLPLSDVYHGLSPEIPRSIHNNPMAFKGVSVSAFKLTLTNEDFSTRIKYLIFYDGKCRTCNESRKIFNQIECNLKNDTCENMGLCYLNKEVHYLMRDIYDNPIENAFICIPSKSQYSLYMPCALNNGNCSSSKTCHFNATTLETNCE